MASQSSSFALVEVAPVDTLAEFEVGMLRDEENLRLANEKIAALDQEAVEITEAEEKPGADLGELSRRRYELIVRKRIAHASRDLVATRAKASSDLFHRDRERHRLEDGRREIDSNLGEMATAAGELEAHPVPVTAAIARYETARRRCIALQEAGFRPTDAGCEAVLAKKFDTARKALGRALGLVY